jgi:hypothetical protein
MPQRPPFPGMNPYLEHPALWPEIHTFLLVNMARLLNTQIIPKYRAAIDQRVYIDTVLVGIPDTTVIRKSATTRSAERLSSQSVAVASRPERVAVPMQVEVKEPFLEIREVETHTVITAVELLSPSNKRTDAGRQQYLEKRQQVLRSRTHFVEIDLLRAGEPMPIEGGRKSDYQILVSRSQERPAAERYPFNLQEAIPGFYLPLQAGDDEPVIDLKQLLLQASEEAAIDLSIDYSQPPVPDLSPEDAAWLQTLSG